MNAMTLAGRRAEIVWKKGSFVGGKGRKQHFDSFVVGFGLVVPFVLREAVHVWDLPMTKWGGGCKAIELRPDPAFRFRVLAFDWSAMGAMALLVGALALGASVHAGLGWLLFLAAVAAGVAAFVVSRQPRRDRDIRLLLGPHAWGSSDPATWGKRLRQDVIDPREAFDSGSFADLARRAMDDGRWAKAMWAARLCAAVEDEELGEELTDDILDEPEVRDGLARVRNFPEERDDEFGKPPGLERWIVCDPRRHVFEIS